MDFLKKLMKKIIALSVKFLPMQIRSRIEEILPVFYNRSEYAIMKNPTFNYDNLISKHLVPFMSDERFLSSFEIATRNVEPRYDYFRVYTACWAAEYAKNLSGHFIECGVYNGVISRAIMNYIEFEKLNKYFYLIDTFEGIPKRFISDREEYIANKHNEKFYGESSTYPQRDTYSFIIDKFSEFGNGVKIIKGIVPDILNEVDFPDIAFLSLDMNNAHAELEAAKYFWEKILKGGVILLDDYAYSEDYILQTEYFDQFAIEKGVSILTLPTGQGLIIKY